MRQVEIKLSELPKYRYDSIINNIKKEFTYEESSNDLAIVLSIDKTIGIRAEVVNKFSLKKRDKDNELQSILINFIDSHLYYQYAALVDITAFYNKYKEWCIVNNLRYYKSINSFYTDKFKKLLLERNMSSNNKVIFNAVFGFRG